MRNYLCLLEQVLQHGSRRRDRTGTGTLGLFGCQLRFDLSSGFPAMTTKKLAFRTMAHELLWFLRAETNIDYLLRNDVRIWDPWAGDDGEVGPLYGVQWRSWPCRAGTGSIDQLAMVIRQLQEDPHSRRHVVSAWNVSELDRMALAPCHMLFQFHVAEGKLSCQVYQRSADLFLGVPFNIASYALLMCMVAQVVGLEPGELIHTMGDAHIYLNHLDVVREQLSREPHSLPTLVLDPSVKSIDDFRVEHLSLEGYRHHPALKAPVSV